jgi:ATP-dependent DNA helicase RecQ
LLEEVTQKVAANPKNSARKTGRIRKAKDVSAAKNPKAEKGDTYRETHELLKEGLTIAQVAERRGLQATTIESHVARCIADGKLDISSFLSSKEIDTVSTAIKNSNEASIKAVFDELKGKFSFGQIRMVLASIAREKQEE